MYMEHETGDMPDYVVFTGEKKFDEKTIKHMQDHTKSFLKTHKSHLGDIDEFKVSIKETHKKGDRKDYEMHARILAKKGEFNAKKEGWDAIDVYEKLIDALKKQIR